MKQALILLMTLMITDVSAQEEISKDSTAKKPFSPFYIYSDRVDISFGTGNWYNYAVNLGLGKGYHKLSLSMQALNLTKAEQIQSFNSFNQIAHHTFGGSHFSLTPRGLYSAGNTSISYTYSIDKEYSLMLGYENSFTTEEYKDSLFRNYFPSAAVFSAFRGSESTKRRFEKNKISMGLSVYPGKNDKTTILWHNDFTLPSTIRSVFSSSKQTAFNDTVINRLENELADTTNGYQLSSILSYSQGFKKSWMYMKLGIEQSDNDYHADFNSRYDLNTGRDTLSLTSKQQNYMRNLEGQFKFLLTERKAPMPTLAINYSQKQSRTNRQSFVKDAALQDSVFSHEAEMIVTTLEPGIEWGMINVKIPFSTKIYYSVADQRYDVVFPTATTVTNQYRNWIGELKFGLPVLKRKYAISTVLNRDTQIPQLNFLQPYTEVIDLYSVSKGSEQLKQSITNTAAVSFSSKESKLGFKFKFQSDYTYTENPVRFVAIQALQDTLLSNGVVAPEGSVFFTYKNFSSENVFNGGVNIEIPVKKLKTNIKMNPRVQQSVIPMANQDHEGEMRQSSYTANVETVTTLLRSFSFLLRYTEQHINTSTSMYYGSTDYVFREGEVFTKWRLPKKSKKKNDQITAQLRFVVKQFDGLPNGFNRTVSILSPSVYYYYSQERFWFEVQLEFFDVLNQNLYYTRTINPFYTENRMTNAMGRSLQVHFKIHPGFLNMNSIERQRERNAGN